MSLRPGLSLLIAAALLALGGCGGGPNFDFQHPESFNADVDALCLSQAEAAARAQMQLGQAESAADEAANLRGIAGAVAMSDSAFAAIEPPDSAVAGYEELLDARAVVAELTESYAVALEGERPKKIVAARRALDAGRDELWDAGSELGLTACSGRLSKRNEATVTELVEVVDTTSDPAKVCEGMVFDSYVDSAFGGVAECRRFQRDAKNTAGSIDVQDVTGTDGIAATVDFRDVAGPFDGRPLRATLFPLDGRWRLWNVVELSD